MSTAVATKTSYTPEDLLDMPDGKSYELVRGQLVERNMGIESSWLGGRLLARLDRFCEEHESGWLFPADSGYQCFPHDPGLVRKPDASFIRRGRFKDNVLPKGWATIPPDLAVEVVAPNDRISDLEEKLSDYRQVGVPLVWVVYPECRSAMVYRRDGTVSRLLENDALSGEDVLPGFQCPVREILPPAGKAEQTQTAANGPSGPG